MCFIQDREFIQQYPSSIIPYRVEFWIPLKERRRQVQSFFRIVILAALHAISN
jgi:hypothetical protein